MSSELIIDNDVIIKLCKYALLIWTDGGLLCDCGIVGIAASRYVLPKQISKNSVDEAAANERRTLASLMDRMTLVEPAPEEVMLAANLEMAAQRAGLLFDSGESQLLALMVARDEAVFLTGDKNAICAVGRLMLQVPEIACAMGRIACLEQLFLRLLEVLGGEAVRRSVCDSPKVDQSLSICFCCSSFAASDERYREGLNSYINNLDTKAGGALVKVHNLLTASA